MSDNSQRVNISRLFAYIKDENTDQNRTTHCFFYQSNRTTVEQAARWCVDTQNNLFYTNLSEFTFT